MDTRNIAKCLQDAICKAQVCESMACNPTLSPVPLSDTILKWVGIAALIALGARGLAKVGLYVVYASMGVILFSNRH